MMQEDLEERAEGFTGAIHATSVAIGGQAVLLRGESGSGKSDLALRMIDRGGLLISDDYTQIHRSGDDVIAVSAANIGGQIEVRGVGIVTLPFLARAPVGLVVMLTGKDGREPERMPPEGRTVRLCGVDLPCLELTARHASTPLKIELALRERCGIIFPAGAAWT